MGAIAMFGWCGGSGAIGWLVVALLWAGLLAVVLWAINRLFPRPEAGPDDVPGAPGRLERDPTRGGPAGR